MSNQIFPPITPGIRVCLTGKSSVEIANYFALEPVPLEEADVALFIVSAVEGIDSPSQELWQSARELYIPSLVLITEITNGEIDFDDMSAIAGRLLDPLLTPYLVLHDDSGFPMALIDLVTLGLSEYLDGKRLERDSDPEHKLLVFEFRKEHLEKIEEFGENSFIQGLSFPAIPFIPENNLGSYEIATYLNRLPGRG